MIQLIINPNNDICLCNTHIARDLLQQSQKWPINLQKALIERLGLKSLACSIEEVTKSLKISMEGFLKKYSTGCRNRSLTDCRRADHELSHLGKRSPHTTKMRSVDDNGTTDVTENNVSKNVREKLKLLLSTI